MSEHDEQVCFAEWLTANNIVHTAIPNSFFSKKTNWGMIKKFHAEGWNAGIPDILCIVPHYDGEMRLVFVEMKDTKLKPKRKGKGGVKPIQQKWINDLNACKEVGAFVAWGCDEAITIIKTLTTK